MPKHKDKGVFENDLRGAFSIKSDVGSAKEYCGDHPLKISLHCFFYFRNC